MTDIFEEIKQAAAKLDAAIELIARFVGSSQLDAIIEAMQGEEQDYFIPKGIGC